MNNHRIFLLTPINNDQNIPSFLIWADDEDSARRKTSAHTGLAGQNAWENPITIEQLKFFQNPNNATCQELKEGEDYTLKKEGALEIVYKGQDYYLKKNRAEGTGEDNRFT